MGEEVSIEGSGYLLPRVSSKLCPSDFIHEALGSLHDVLALLGCLLHLACQEEAAASRHLQHISGGVQIFFRQLCKIRYLLDSLLNN